MSFVSRLQAAPSRAFCLTELLVVVAIIALLAAIIAPALNLARNAARITVCATNQKQIGIAWYMYLSDNDYTFPRQKQNISWFYGGKEPCIVTGLYTGRNSPVLDHRPLNPYVKLRERNQAWADVFRCTGDRPITDDNGKPAVTDGHTTYDYFGNSYTLNWLLTLPWDIGGVGPLYHQSMHLSDVEVPHDRLMLVGDCQWYYTEHGTVWNAQFHRPPDHMNLTFLDGHVAFTRVYRPEEFEQDENIRPAYTFWPYKYWPGQEEEDQ